MHKNEKGGVALEYVLVTTFAAVGTTIILGFMTLIAKKNLEELGRKHQVDPDFSQIEDLFKYEP